MTRFLSPLWTLFCVSTLLDGQSARSVADGVYADTQARRGQPLYREECARCHGESLNGGESSPELAGEAFIERWKGQTLADLLERIRTTMPSDSPGRLSRQQYADSVAYKLKTNKYPAGQKELARDTDSLRQIRIEPAK
jgi:mono/diheme cytochrome c family protein